MLGFSQEQRDKLIKLIKSSGATRYDSISNGISHIVVGDPLSQEVKEIQHKISQFAVVNVKWIIDSMEKEHPVAYEDYCVKIPKSPVNDIGSPLSKKVCLVVIFKGNNLYHKIHFSAIINDSTYNFKNSP